VGGAGSEDWWRAAERAVAALRQQEPRALAAVRGMGLSGQMHGAVLLDAGDRVLRPAILWNDGRAGAECAELERRARLHAIAGNLDARLHGAEAAVGGDPEPDAFAATAHVLLPRTGSGCA
jgi:xylulokinase